MYFWGNSEPFLFYAGTKKNKKKTFSAFWSASLFVLVVPLGEMCAALAMQRLGRLAAIRLALVPHSLGWALIACASNFQMILMGKVLCGVSYCEY